MTYSMGEKATKNFYWSEFYCPAAKHMILEPFVFVHIEKLQKLRDEFGPLKVNSAYRSPEHNDSVGGASKSMHLRFATDIAPAKSMPQPELNDFFDLVEEKAIELDFKGIGRYHSFIHLDCRHLINRPPANWDYR